MTIAITQKQIEQLASDLQARYKKEYDLSDITEIFDQLIVDLNKGLILSSGDGFRYRFTHQFGNLVAHDGSKLKGSLYIQLRDKVWGEERFHEVMNGLVENCNSSLDPIPDVLRDMGYAL